LDQEQCTFAEALAEAQTLGLTEPDPSRDLDGLDAADKLSLLAAIFGWGSLPPARIDPQGIREITANDLAVARALGATIKPVAHASLTPAGISGFIGPTLVPLRHPLAALRGTLSGIQLSGRFVADLFFSGPGAGPDITAATILDDAVEAVSTAPKAPRVTTRAARALPVATAPATRWLIRARFPGIVPDATTAAQMFASNHLAVERVTDAIDDARWMQLATATREDVSRAITHINSTHRVHCFAIRSL
jgi:homoserine dehydrogenase